MNTSGTTQTTSTKTDTHIPPKTDDSSKRKSENTTTPSSSSKPPSNVLHITNLTRPFTVNQLKELLTKYGHLLEIKREDKLPSATSTEQHYFWINSVKSHCYVAFENESDARTARDALDNLTWPQSNPKQLKAEFSSMDDLVFNLNSDKPTIITKQAASELNAATGITLTVKNDKSTLNGNDKENALRSDRDRKDRDRSKDKDRSSNRDRGADSGKQSSKNAVREWDLPKLAARSGRSRSRSREKRKEDRRGEQATNENHVERKKTKLEDDKPPKTLDDLFRKTVQTPFIYWLPLTEEQFLEKQKENEKRMNERLRRAEERKQKENAPEVKPEEEKSAKKVEEEGEVVEPGEVVAKLDSSGASDQQKEVEAKPEAAKKETSQRDRDRDRDVRDRDRYSGRDNRARSPPRRPRSPPRRDFRDRDRDRDRERRRSPPAYQRNDRDRRDAPAASRSDRAEARPQAERKPRSTSRSGSGSSRSSSSSSSGSRSSSSGSSSSGSSSSRSRSRSAGSVKKNGKLDQNGKHSRSGSDDSAGRKKLKTSNDKNRNGRNSEERVGGSANRRR